MKNKGHAEPSNTQSTEIHQWTEYSMEAKIAEKNRVYCEQHGMPEWMLNGFKNYSLQGRA